MGTELQLLSGEASQHHWSPTVDLSFDDIADALSIATTIEQAHQYWIGDILIHAQARFDEAYAQLIPEGREDAYKQYMWTCSRVPAETRKLLPSYSHARAIASLPPDDQISVIQTLPAGSTTREVKKAVAARKPASRTKKKPWSVALLTWGRIKQEIEAFEGMTDDTPIILNIGPDANEVTVYEGPGENTTLYAEGWHGDDYAALCVVSRNEML